MTKAEYQDALKRIDELFHISKDDPRADELDELICRVEEYEDRLFNMEID